MRRGSRVSAVLIAAALVAGLAVGTAGASAAPGDVAGPAAAPTRSPVHAAAEWPDWSADPDSWAALHGAVSRGEALVGSAKAADGMTPAQRLEANLAAFDAAVTDYFERNGVPGAVVGLVAGDKVIYQRALGVKQAGGDDPVDLGTLFQIGSTTKAFTSALLGTFVDQGVLDWGDLVRQWYPGLRLSDEDRAERLTIVDTLSHRSGYPSYATDELMAFGADRQDLLDKLHFVQPVAPFRWQFNYQNVFIMIGGVVAEAAGAEPWDQLVDERLFGPVGMPTATATFGQLMSVPNRVSGHTGAPGGPYTATALVNADPDGPAGVIGAPLPEMLRWVRMQLNGGEIDGVRVISEASLAKTHQPQTIARPSPQGLMAYGLCWVVENLNGVRSVWHSGSTGVNGAIVRLLPNDGIGMVVLANAEKQLLGPALSGVLEDLAYLGTVTKDYYQVAYDQATKPTEPSYPVLPADPPSDPEPPAPLETYAGAYLDPYYGSITVTVVDGTLAMRLGTTPDEGLLVAWDGDVFAEPTTNTAVRFTVGDGGGTAVALHWDYLEQPGFPVQQFQRAEA